MTLCFSSSTFFHLFLDKQIHFLLSWQYFKFTFIPSAFLQHMENVFCEFDHHLLNSEYSCGSPRQAIDLLGKYLDIFLDY